MTDKMIFCKTLHVIVLFNWPLAISSFQGRLVKDIRNGDASVHAKSAVLEFTWLYFTKDPHELSQRPIFANAAPMQVQCRAKWWIVQLEHHPATPRYVFDMDSRITEDYSSREHHAILGDVAARRHADGILGQFRRESECLPTWLAGVSDCKKHVQPYSHIRQSL